MFETSGRLSSQRGMSETVSFGQWLKQRRKSLDLTQGGLASEVGCSIVTIRKIEGDELRPSRQIAERLALALGIEPAEQEAFVLFARSAGGNWQPAPIGGRPEDRPWHPPAANNRLPVPLTAVIGREREVTAGCALLRRPEVRLVTLSGPPGIGKTRLSLQTAEALAEEFDGEVYFVPLAPIFDAQLVLPAIAQEVGVRELGNQSLMASLRERFRGKQALLVLDNFEQVTAAAPVIAELLMSVTGLKVLVTSRELLHIYGEQEFPVPALALPDLHNLPPVEALALYPSIALFVQRAQAAKFGFELTAENGAAVAGICAWLDGLPLAIEMAAARVKWLAPAALLQRLSQRLSLLSDGPRNLTPRQQTLRGAIDWSYELLEEEERSLFSGVAVFRGGCTAEAVEAIVNGQLSTANCQLGECEGKLHALVDKSLLRYEMARDGEGRFWMLETIREYGLERLAASGRESDTRQAHAAYFLALAEEGEQALMGAAQATWLERLEREHDNLRAALEWALANEAGVETAGRMGAALWRFWRLRGHISEGRRWLAQIIHRGQSGQDSVLWAKVLFGAGSLASQTGETTAARTLFEQSLRLYRTLGDKPGIAQVLSGLGGVAFFDEGNPEEAARLFEESLALRREIGDRWAIAVSLNNLGVVAYNLGRFEEALGLHEESLAIRRELGDEWGVAQSLGNLGFTHYHLGDGRARPYFEQSLIMQRSLGVQMGVADALDGLGDVALAEGKAVEAAAYYAESLALAQESGSPRDMGQTLERLGMVALVWGKPEEAALLLGAADGLLVGSTPATHRAERPHYGRLVSSLQAELGEARLAGLRTAGEEMEVEEAVALAMGSVKRET
jgi:predicted ATPase/transcriptional regulator with XRE-family HTH domain